MSIDLYITKLLYFHDRIVLPGIGTFIARYQPAFINNETNTIYPPRRKIIFSDEYKKDNGILTEYISEQENISINEAKQKLDAFCKKIIDKINKDGKVSLIKLGQLVKENNKIVFKPTYKGTYFLETQGMTEVKLKSIPQEPEPFDRDKLKTIISKPVDRNKKTLKKILLYSSLAVSIILVLVFLDSIIFYEEKPEELFNNNYYKIPENNSSLNISTDIDSQFNQKNALSYKEPQPKIHNYYIIAGSFTEYKNAEKLKQTLIKKGFNAGIIENDGKYFRVSVKSFDSKSDALAELNYFKNKLGNGLWILEK